MSENQRRKIYVVWMLNESLSSLVTKVTQWAELETTFRDFISSSALEPSKETFVSLCSVCAGPLLHQSSLESAKIRQICCCRFPKPSFHSKASKICSIKRVASDWEGEQWKKSWSSREKMYEVNGYINLLGANLKSPFKLLLLALLLKREKSTFH